MRWAPMATAWALAAVTAHGSPGSVVPRFRIDLDTEPEERFAEVMARFQATLDDLYASVVDSPLVKALVDKIAEHRGPERDEELAGEVRGYAKHSRLPLQAYQAAQLLYELQTIMVPVENVTWPWGQTTQRTGDEPTFGCTGIIARSADNGTVTHARNLDFSFAKWLQNMTYDAVFVKGGKELFIAQMVAGYSSPLTGMRRGANGYTVEVNTRYPPKSTNVKNLIDLVFKEKRTPSGWIRRQILQSVDNYDDAVRAFSTRPYASTEFNIISGNQKGVILARDPDSVYHTQVLGPNKNDYVIMTNFDYWDHDFKEWFDPTCHTFGHSRRIGAERLLNSSNNINFDELYKVMNDQEVMAKDTIFQAFMNVQEDTYQSFLPACEDCRGCTIGGECMQSGAGCCGERSHFSIECAAHGGRRCGCLPDGACRAPDENTTQGDQDCCSFQSHMSMDCPFGKRCGAKAHAELAYV